MDIHHPSSAECKGSSPDTCDLREYLSGASVGTGHLNKFNIKADEGCAYLKKKAGGIKGEECTKTKNVMCQIDCSQGGVYLYYVLSR